MDEISITLPVSKIEVIIRNYTTRKDDEAAENALYMGVNAEQSDLEGASKSKKSVKTVMKFPVANVMAQNHVYIRRLVQSIDGDSNSIAIRLGDLRSQDYEEISKSVTEIVEANSPKAKEG